MTPEEYEVWKKQFLLRGTVFGSAALYIFIGIALLMILWRVTS